MNLRYSRELRDNLPSLREILVPTLTGHHIPLGQLADIGIVKGPPAIKSENARPNAWVYVDIQGIDVGTYVQRAKQAVAEQVQVPAGYNLAWSGQYEYMLRAQERLMYVVPMTILIIFVIIYLNTRSVFKTLIVLLAVPFSLVGAFWLLYLLGYNMSIAVWVGIIALAGLDAEVTVTLSRDAGTPSDSNRPAWSAVCADTGKLETSARARVRPRLPKASLVAASTRIFGRIAPART